MASAGTFLSNFEPLDPGPGAGTWWITWSSSISYTEPMKKLLRRFRWPRRQAGLRGLFGASAPGGRQAFQESTLSAEAARSGRRRATAISPKSRARLEREIPADQPGPFPGQCRLGRTPQQSARSRNRAAAARRLQSDSLSGTARAVHGVHLQPDRQIARRPPDSAAKAR